MDCVTCLELHGAGCEGTHEDAEGKLVCLFCLDGELCPVRAKRLRASRKKTPEETPPAASDENSTDRASEVKSEGTMSETRANAPETAPKMCKRPGCEIKLSAANVIGLCQRHVRWTGERTSSGAHAAANGSARKTNGNGHAASPANGNGAAAVLPELAADRVDQLLATLTAGDKARIALAWLRGEL